MDRLQKMVRMKRLESLTAAARQLKELQDHLESLLPVLEATYARVAHEISLAIDGALSLWRSVTTEISTVTAHVRRRLQELYRVVHAEISAVARAVAAKYREIADSVEATTSVLRAQWLEIWSTHEELRLVVRNVLGAAVLLLWGAAFLWLYHVTALVPSFLATMYRTLDDITRAQLKIVAVLALALTVYLLRSLWSFWLSLAALVVFYYWSGHVLERHLKPEPPTMLSSSTAPQWSSVVHDASSLKPRRR
ncbi:hypothetical protein PINS_up012652 [Pythium insidiosum]|nr:hypothetical protein PINS_up012652 [Pythium insidiosum]